MEKNEEKAVLKRNTFNILNMNENITFIDLSNQHFTYLNDNLTLPIHLSEINLSHNSLTRVPQSIMDLTNIRKLDLSYNNIESFDEVPNFCNIIEDLDLSNNNIHSPPYWVWAASPKNLIKFNISNNTNLKALKDEFLLEFLRYRTLVKEVIIHNCRINKDYELIATFVNAKSIQLGNSYTSYKANAFYDIPFKSLIECINLEKLNVQNTFINTVTPKIGVFKNLIEIDLSYNKIHTLPKEFCTLKNLEVCLLSFNQLLYLPEEILELQKLKVLSLNNNELCMLPNNWSNMKNLKCLDLYDNFLCDVPEIDNYDEIDLAQNYFKEPENDIYIEKQKKIRLNYSEQRYCGRKKEVVKDECNHTPNLTDDEFQYNEYENNETSQNRPSSTSSEDWEAEDWWVPQLTAKSRTFTQSPWVMFIQKKIDEGHFCPIDLHKEPINKVSQPKVLRTVSGQFDDYSDDDNE
ncbi:leucine-rich repeat protein soc-2 homolog [Pieris brassicae]|nr:leucine-rich repeat protein soc-2 homolog [Pieris brassicae]